LVARSNRKSLQLFLTTLQELKRPQQGRKKMGRLAAGLVIAIAALAMNGSLVRDVLAEGSVRLGGSPVSGLSANSPAASGLRSERVLSLLLTLEALRAAPEVLGKAKD
jgi:hypothetical protein